MSRISESVFGYPIVPFPRHLLIDLRLTLIKEVRIRPETWCKNVGQKELFLV